MIIEDIIYENKQENEPSSFLSDQKFRFRWSNNVNGIALFSGILQKPCALDIDDKKKTYKTMNDLIDAMELCSVNLSA